MAVKVLITRRYQEGTLVDMMMALGRLRASAISQPGYISGQTLISRSDPQKLVVISTWEDQASWEKWKNSAARLEQEAAVEPFLLEKTRYEVFAPGAVPG